MTISDNDFIEDGIDDWMSDGIDGTIEIKFVKPKERRRSGGTLFRRNESDIYTARFVGPDGRRVDRSTGCTDLAEAEATIDGWVAESRVLAFLRRNGPSTERDIRLGAGGFQRPGDLLKRTLLDLWEQHLADPAMGVTKTQRRQSGHGGRTTDEYALPSSPCRCDGCKPSHVTMTSGIRTVGQLVAEYKHKIEASNRLVMLRREVIELHDLAEDGGFRCVPYCVPLDEVRTKAGQIEWIRHLCEKSWITPTHILKFIDACESACARKESA